MRAHRGYFFAYDVERALLPARLAERLIPLDFDDPARAFVDRALDAPHGRLAMAAHRALRPVLSDFDINGILGTHPMHLLSEPQWRRVLGSAAAGRLLDVGAGSGDVTATLAPLFESVQTTETAWAMARRLRARGFPCWQLDAAADELPERGFSVVACLNVIDRTDKPRSLLERLRGALARGGRLVLATPLPLSAFVYDGGSSRDPSESLRVDSPIWELAAAELAERELAPLGFAVEALCRAPYLSHGGQKHPLAVLDDAVFVCSAA